LRLNGILYGCGLVIVKLLNTEWITYWMVLFLAIVFHSTSRSISFMIIICWSLLVYDCAWIVRWLSLTTFCFLQLSLICYCLLLRWLNIFRGVLYSLVNLLHFFRLSLFVQRISLLLSQGLISSVLWSWLDIIRLISSSQIGSLLIIDFLSIGVVLRTATLRVNIGVRLRFFNEAVSLGSIILTSLLSFLILVCPILISLAILSICFCIPHFLLSFVLVCSILLNYICFGLLSKIMKISAILLICIFVVILLNKQGFLLNFFSILFFTSPFWLILLIKLLTFESPSFFTNVLFTFIIVRIFRKYHTMLNFKSISELIYFSRIMRII